VTPEEADRIKRLEAAVDAARRRFAADAAKLATDEPTMHFAERLLGSFESLGDAVRRYRYARDHREEGRDGRG